MANFRFKALLICVFTANMGMHAQSTSKSMLDSIFQLDNVVVTAPNIRKEITPVQVLSGKALSRLSVHSVADALRYFSGVQIKDYGGIGGLKTVNIRSMGSHHVGVFYDGIELGNAQNGVIDLGRFSLDNMEAISLYNGQKSNLLQTAKDFASASAVYMITRHPRFQAQQKTHLRIGLKTGSFDTANPSFLWENKWSEHLSSSVSTEYLYTSGRYKFSYRKKNGYDTTEIRKNGDVRMLRAEAALFGRLAKGEWQNKMYFYRSERGYPGASVREEPGKFIHQDRQWDTNFFLQASFRNHFQPWYNLQINAKYAYDYLHYRSDPRLDVTTMYVDNQYRQQEGYLSIAQLFSPFSWWSASLSNDAQINYLDADLVDFVYPTRYSVLSALATSFEFNRLKAQASLLHTFVHEKTLIKGANAADKSLITPSAVLSYRPFAKKNLHLRAFYKSIFRMPTLNDLYYTFIGNKDLKPEYTTQYDIGITYTHTSRHSHLRQYEIQADIYHNQVKDKIIAMPTSNQFRWTMLNLGIVGIKGLDVSLQQTWQWEDLQIVPRLSYTYQKAQDFTDKESPWYGGQIPYIPWHSGSVIISGNYRTWSYNYSFIYTGERYEAVANIPENYAQPWYTHDFSLTKSFTFKKGEILKITAELNNILNQQYEVVQCYPMPGFNYKLRLTYEL